MRGKDSTEKRIFRDQDFILLNINALLVIVGYGIAVYTHLDSVAVMKFIKSFFLVLSAIVLFKDMKLTRNPIPSPTIIYIIIFSFWVFLLSFFSEDVVFAILRSLNFILPFIYVYITLHNLLNKYNALDLLKAFIKSFNLIYLLPVASFLLAKGGLGETNIYGLSTRAGQFFVSNQYGWASTMFLITTVDIFLNSKPKGSYRLMLLIFGVLAVYLVLISGNRASWLSLILAAMIFILRLKNIRADYKILILILPVAAALWFAQLPESSFKSRMNDTEMQLEKGEARFNTAELAINKFDENKLLWLTGAGMFNYEEIIHGEGLADFHNSYFEVLFGGGIILFLMFVSFMIFRPMYYYTIHYSKFFLIVPPVVVIPFFESNLTGGQFLFFPWFVIMLLLNIPPGFNISKSVQATSTPQLDKIPQI